MICTYCGCFTDRVTGKEIYPYLKHLHKKTFIQCKPCEAYVGTHADGKPLGTLANKGLRAYRIKCHDEFDKLWKSKHMKRNEAYVWLGLKMKKTRADAHIGMFNQQECQKLLQILKEES